MIEAVVFDLDGVIIDSEPVWEQVRRQVVAENGGRWAAGAQQSVPHPRYPPDPDALAAASLVLTGLDQLTPAVVAAL